MKINIVVLKGELIFENSIFLKQENTMVRNLSLLLVPGILSFMAGFSCQNSSRDIAEESTASTLDFVRIADHLVAQAALQPGEQVLLVAMPGRFDTLVPLLRERIAEAEAVDLGAISVSDLQLDEWSTDFTRGAAGKDLEALAAYFSEVDLGIMLPGATADHAPYAALQEVLRQGQGRTIHFHWSGAYDLNQNELPIDPAIDAFYQRALLETDYDSLATAQQQFEAAMRGQQVRVATPSGTDIRFRIGNRPVTKQDGDASADRARRARNLIDREIELPAGAIRVAPLEESVEGTIAFPDAVWNGRPVTGLTMTFDNGRVSNFQANTGVEAVTAALQQAGAAGRAFREFALGFNPLLAIPEQDPWIPYYGYGAGVVRLSLGDNTELGGNVGGGYVRWNFFPDATVLVGDTLWVQDGRMVKLWLRSQ
jgi:hypothetical protein